MGDTMIDCDNVIEQSKRVRCSSSDGDVLQSCYTTLDSTTLVDVDLEFFGSEKYLKRLEDISEKCFTGVVAEALL
jgi:hypothetical protein